MSIINHLKKQLNDMCSMFEADAAIATVNAVL